MDFQKFKIAVAQQFERMKASGKLFQTAVERDKLWETYLGSFPPGSDPIFRQRTNHDCSCCRSFVKTAGNVVSIKDGMVSTIWDVEVDDPAYQAVADSLAVLVRNASVGNVFLHYEKTVGTDRNFESLLEGGQRQWDHFFVNLPNFAVAAKDRIGLLLGDKRATYDVMLRSLSEITDEAVATVMELISQGSLYRGEEHKFAVSEFGKLKVAFRSATDPSLFVWERFAELPQSVSRIRNTAIGTLLVDLSEGVDLEHAVKSFETKVAPTNYKRPTALVTQAMINSAKVTIEELGLTSALERRYARLQDITVNNILFADREAKKAISGTVFDDLTATKAVKQSMDKVEDVPIEKFLSEILPQVTSVEVMLENRHALNFVSLIAPCDPTARPLFKWDNQFSWSYNGEVADSIKERVKAAGGAIEGDLCCRLAWDNSDDLDFHMYEPDGWHIYFGDRRSRCGGILDVDANGMDGIRPDPVENIVYKDRRKMVKGTYRLIVHQYNQRTRENIGFEVEIEVGGKIYSMKYDKVMPRDAQIEVANIKYDGNEFEVETLLSCEQKSRIVWGVPTQQFHRASVVMLSPNYWDGQGVGNKHYFFMIDSAKNEGQARGFYNEFLKPELNDHRKVLELVGSKTKAVDDPHQLSGLGFSSTQRNNLLCRVKGSFTRNINIIF